jgi:transcription elongation factor Elf1
MIASNGQLRARARARAATLPRALRSITRCLVCGFREVRTDEVIERGVVMLHECPRCDHRWTECSLAPALAGVAHEADAPVAA